MSVRDAVIVSTARTPIGRAYKGAFNATPVADPRRPSRSAPRSSAPGSTAGRDRRRASWGAALQQGVQATTSAAPAALRAGLPGHRRRHDDRPPVRVAA